jgi:hypothetical protein
MGMLAMTSDKFDDSRTIDDDRIARKNEGGGVRACQSSTCAAARMKMGLRGAWSARGALPSDTELLYYIVSVFQLARGWGVDVICIDTHSLINS